MSFVILVVILLLILCACLGAWSWFLYKKLGSKETGAHYYETSEWCQHEKGLHYAQDDENMDSLVYLPNRGIVCWFDQRNVAKVQDNGTFILKWPNGGQMAGTIHPLDEQIELVGLPGTSEDGITETMLLSK